MNLEKTQEAFRVWKEQIGIPFSRTFAQIVATHASRNLFWVDEAGAREIEQLGQKYLDLSDDEAAFLFRSGFVTSEQLGDIIKKIAGRQKEVRNSSPPSVPTPKVAPELDTINRLYLELSQVATAKTARELELEELLRSAHCIAERNGRNTDWKLFLYNIERLGLNEATERGFEVSDPQED